MRNNIRNRETHKSHSIWPVWVDMGGAALRPNASKSFSKFCINSHSIVNHNHRQYRTFVHKLAHKYVSFMSLAGTHHNIRYCMSSVLECFSTLFFCFRCVPLADASIRICIHMSYIRNASQMNFECVRGVFVVVYSSLWST